MDDGLLATVATRDSPSELCGMLVGSAKGLGDYQEVGRRPVGALRLVTRGTPFAFTEGISSVHDRFATALMQAAVATGASTSGAGPRWMQLVLVRSEYARFDLAFWCGKACDSARHPDHA